MPKCTTTAKTIQILLSTYNGEKYIREQLDSYLSLAEAGRIKVLIRDDGSRDHTLEILKEYRGRHGFEVHNGENLGVNESMFWLFNHCDLTCDYFAISDQDDVWVRDKLTTALGYLADADEDRPALFASCSQIVDENLNTLGTTLVPQKSVSFFNAMVQNVTPGHTQVFNRTMMQEVIQKGISDVHVIDWWLYLVATGIGQIFFDRKVTVLHRQHGINAVGYELNFWRQTLMRLKKLRGNKGNGISLQLRSFYNRYGKLLKAEEKHEVERYFECQRNIISRLSYALTCRAYRQTWFETLLFKLLYIFGKYNV